MTCVIWDYETKRTNTHVVLNRPTPKSGISSDTTLSRPKIWFQVSGHDRGLKIQTSKGHFNVNMCWTIASLKLIFLNAKKTGERKTNCSCLNHHHYKLVISNIKTLIAQADLQPEKAGDSPGFKGSLLLIICSQIRARKKRKKMPDIT